MGDNNITSLKVEKNFGVQCDLEKDMQSLIEKYSGNMSLAQFIGVIEIVKQNLMQGHSE